MARKLYLWLLEMRQDEHTKVVVLAHSLGALVCSYLTSKVFIFLFLYNHSDLLFLCTMKKKKHPELIDQLILVSPAGMNKKPPTASTKARV